MKILGIETSCDETACAILQNDNKSIQILSNIISSSANLQEKYGGIIPEKAAREQLKFIIPVIESALKQADCKIGQIDAIAVTQGPGLIGSLLVGVETAKTLALVFKKPLIPINHLIGHFYANWIGHTPKFPCIGLLVSGGHTDLVLFTDHGKYKYLGGTRDDAVGECFDKCARLLGFSYPGGPKISKLAQNGNPKKFPLPRPMIDSNNFDFSFSGLKTAFINLVEEKFRTSKKAHTDIGSSWKEVSDSKNNQDLADLCASLETAAIEVLVKKAALAVLRHKANQIVVAGGVAANQKLAEFLVKTIKTKNSSREVIFIPPPILCTDNAAMIAASAFFIKKEINPLKLQANPNLSLS